MKLAAYIKAVDGSEAAFARRAGIDQKTVWSLCRGRTTPRGDTIQKILRACQEKPSPNGKAVTLDDLLGKSAA